MKKILAVALLSTCIATPAIAADNSGKFYGALDTGTVAMANAGTYPNPSSVSLSVGYHYSANLAVEAVYTSISPSTTDIASGTQWLTYKQSMWSAAAVGTYPVSESIDLFGKLGLGMVTGTLEVNDMFLGPSSSSATTSSVIYGIGAMYNFNKQVGIRAQYESLGKTTPDSSTTGLDLTRASVGLVYNF